MLNSTSMQQNWDQLRGKLRQKWSQLTDADLREFNGNVEELVARIQQKTGDSREAIQSFLQNASQEGAGVVNRVRDRFEETMSGARETMNQATGQARETYQQMQDRFSHTVQEQPGIAVAAAFGLGLLAGIGLAVVFLQSEQESTAQRYSRQAEHFGRKFWDTIAQNLPESLSRHA